MSEPNASILGQEDAIADINATFLRILNVVTPGSDINFGTQESEIIWGRDGSDTLLGFDPGADNPNQWQIDIFQGDGDSVPTEQGIVSRGWNDRFILGDWRQPYYANSQPLIFGLNEFALILDFNSKQDIIQLHGTSVDYQLAESPLGTAVVWQQEASPDVVAFLLGVSNLSLEGDYFQFEGDTPPKGPVLGKTQQLGTVGVDFSISSATTPLGNVYLAGATSGSLGGSNVGSYDAWVAQYESDGNQIWLQQFGTELIDATSSIDVDDKGNVYLSGFTIKEEPSLPLPFQDDVWVTKYDSDGNRQWFREFGTPTLDEAYGVAVDYKGNVYSTGWTVGDFGGENAGLYDIWVAKHDTNGQLKWLEQFGTDDYEFPWGIDTDSKGNIYVAGWTLGKLGEENIGSYDAWLAKYDSNGNQVWLQQFGTVGDDAARGIKVDFNGDIFLTGYTDNNFEGRNAGSYDVWAAKYDSNGNPLWIQQFGTPNLDAASNVSVDNAGSLYITGITQGSSGDINAGAEDSWVAKLDAKNGTLQDFNGTPERVNENDLLIGGDSAGTLNGNLKDDILNKGIGANVGSLGGEAIKSSVLPEFSTTDAFTPWLTGLPQAVNGAAEVPIVDDPLNGSLVSLGLDVSDKSVIASLNEF